MTDEQSWDAHRLLVLEGIKEIKQTIKENQNITAMLIAQSGRDAEEAHTRLRHDLEAGEARTNAQHDLLSTMMVTLQKSINTIETERRIEKEQIASRSTYMTIGISVALNAAWEIIRGKVLKG